MGGDDSRRRRDPRRYASLARTRADPTRTELLQLVLMQGFGRGGGRGGGDGARVDVGEDGLEEREVGRLCALQDVSKARKCE